MLEPSDAPIEDQLLSFIRCWFDLIAGGRTSEACSMLDEPNSDGMVWTAAMIESVLGETFGPGTLFHSEHPDGPTFSFSANTVGPCRPSVGRFLDGSGFWVDHEVPLNGKWSDLTAQFEFHWRGGRLAAVLHDLHVL